MRRHICCVVLVLLVPGTTLSQGRLEQIRREADGTAEPKDNPRDDDKKRKRDNSHSDRDHCDDSDDDSIWGELFLSAVISPFAMPRVALEGDSPARAYFPDHPYLNNHSGHLFFPDHDNESAEPGDAIRIRKWSLRLSGEEGNDFRGMNRVGVRAALDTSWRLGVSTNWNILSESLDNNRRDSTVLSDTNITFRFAQHEHAQFHTGIGLRMMIDPAGTHTGFNFLYGVDLFPRKPFTASALFDCGNVGSAFVLHGRATIGAAWKHFDVYTGYDFMRIGSVNVQGPMLGLRFWY